MMKKPDCAHQFKDESECQPAFRNVYKCERCGYGWEDVWSCGCDDDCPQCGARHMSPVESDEIAPCACDYLGTLVMRVKA